MEAVGAAAFPLAYFLLPRLRDRGYSVSKPLGILLIGYASWILSQLHLLPSVRLSIAGLFLVMAGLSGWYAWRRRRELKDFFLREWRVVVVAEVVFLVFFVGWTFYRACDPAIDHTEQPMDLAFLNASIRSDMGAPEDPWLRGESVSYYYFGYWMMGTLSQLTGISSNVSYNLAMTLLPALAAMGMFGLVYNIVFSKAGRLRYAIAGGFAGALLLGVVANLEGVLEFMRANAMGSEGFWDWVRIDGLDGPRAEPADSWMPEEFWWWFRATRVINTFDGAQGIDYTIQEFPFFSFMLGDLHAHVMSIPFAILFIALCWDFLRSPAHTWDGRNLRGYAFILTTGLVLGGIAFTNMWDLPTYAALFLGIAVLKAYARPSGGTRSLVTGAVLPGLAVIGLAFILFLPYYLTFQSSVSGIGPVAVATTRPVHMAIVWGLYLAAVVPFIVGTFWQTTVRNDWLRTTALALMVAFVPFGVWAVLHLYNDGAAGDLGARYFHVLPFGILISVAVYSAFWVVREEGDTGKAFALALAALGLLLVMGPELLFVKDAFGNRMNTVFKLYYQAWILLAASSGFALYYWSSLRESLGSWKKSMTTLWAGIVVALLLGSVYYPAAAAASKGGSFTDGATLDGLAFLNEVRPAERDAIEFVKRNVDRDAAIVEAVGEWFDAGLISRSTGVPTVINWPGHEVQWRGSAVSFEGRERDVSLIYQTLDATEAKNLLDRYNVEYVYVGPREQDKYGAEGMAKFSSEIFDTVFSQGDVAIYRVR